MDESSGIYKFVSVGELAETTTQMLAFGLQTRTRLGGRADGHNEHSMERVEQLILQQARDYLAEVREGFVLSVRSTKVNDAAELQFLLERVLLDWSTLSQQLGLEEESSEQGAAASSPPTLERVRQQLLAYGMAASALAQLPRLPAEQITFPYSYSNPPSYADIPAPDSAGDMLWRIEELEQMLWRLMSGDLQNLVERRYGALRRTYGFFETSAHLANREAERFGIKPSNKRLLLL